MSEKNDGRRPKKSCLLNNKMNEKRFQNFAFDQDANKVTSKGLVFKSTNRLGSQYYFCFFEKDKSGLKFINTTAQVRSYCTTEYVLEFLHSAHLRFGQIET